MSFTMQIRFRGASELNEPSNRYVEREVIRLEKAGWTVSGELSPRPNFEITIEREIQQLYLTEVHWNTRFLGLEPTEIGVVFQNSLLPKPFPSWEMSTGKRFRDTSGKRESFGNDFFPGFWYEISADSKQKILKVCVSGGQQLGQENWKKFLWKLTVICDVTRVTRHLHQFRMAAGKQSVPEMDRHHNEILQSLADLLLG